MGGALSVKLLRREIIGVELRKTGPRIVVHRAKLHQPKIAWRVIQSIRFEAALRRDQVSPPFEIAPVRHARSSRTMMEEQYRPRRIPPNNQRLDQHRWQRERQPDQRAQHFETAIQRLRQPIGGANDIADRDCMRLAVLRPAGCPRGVGPDSRRRTLVDRERAAVDEIWRAHGRLSPIRETSICAASPRHHRVHTRIWGFAIIQPPFRRATSRLNGCAPLQGRGRHI